MRGSAASLDACWDAVRKVRKEGTVVQVGVYPGPVQTDVNQVMMKELRYTGTQDGRATKVILTPAKRV